MEDQDTAMNEPAAVEKATLVVHSGDFDKIYSAFIIGNGALAMGMEASMYFTFWGLLRLKKGQARQRSALQDAHARLGQMDGQAEDEEKQRRFPGAAGPGFQGRSAARSSRAT